MTQIKRGEMTNPVILNSPPLANIPWEDKPAGETDVVWRYSHNPIIPRNATPTSNSIFNSAILTSLHLINFNMIDYKMCF